MDIPFLKLRPEAIAPTRANPSDAGNDLYAVEEVVIGAGQRKLIKTGLAVAIPEGFYGRIADRSGLALKAGLSVKGGVIDAAYRGEIGIIIINESLPYENPDFRVTPGMKIAQMIIERCAPANWVEAKELPATNRGDGGFGSTGT